MSGTTLKSSAPVSDRDAQIASAVDALRAGRLAILPTETVYGIAADARTGVGSLRERMAKAADGENTGGGGLGRLTWHVPTVDALISGLGLTHPMHLRIAKRLAPGPIRFLRTRSSEDAAALRQSLGVAAGVIDEKNEFAIRVPDQALTRDVLSKVGGPVVMERLSSLGLGDGTRLTMAIIEQATALGIHPIVDEGPTRYGSPSSTVRLLDHGKYEVVTIANSGVYDEKRIKRKVDRLVLFVCTGNTCRSPMAEAIARHLLSQTPPTIVTKVASAGVSAGMGQPMTPEAQQALLELGMAASSKTGERGGANQHRSQDLSRDLADQAEVIFAMTRSHARMIEQIAPSTRGRIYVLDPAGADVDDPIGGPMELYRSTAKKLRGMIERRLEQLEKEELPRGGSFPAGVGESA